MADNRQLTGAFDSTWLNLGNGQVLGIPIVSKYLLVLWVGRRIVFEHTLVGRRLFAVGSNLEAARPAGLTVERKIYGSTMHTALKDGTGDRECSHEAGEEGEKYVK